MVKSEAHSGPRPIIPASRMDIRALIEELRRYTGTRRHAHSLNVMQAAAELARIHAPVLREQAELAGLLHDNAKKLEDTELIQLARDNNIEITAVELSQPSLLHGKVGALLLAPRFGISDPAIALAVSDHVTGRPNMGLLSRVLYVADQCALDRTFPGVELLRSVAGKDLEQAVLLVARNKLLSVIQRGYLVEPNTAALYNEQVMAGVPLPAGVSDFGGQD